MQPNFANNINGRYFLGKGEVVSSILTGSTTKAHESRAFEPARNPDRFLRYATKREQRNSNGGISVEKSRSVLGKIYTETQVATVLHRERRWLLDWLRANPADRNGEPFYLRLGRSRRFTGDDIVRLIDAILTGDEATKAKPTSEGAVYFIDGGDRIKIGFSKAMRSRMQSFKTHLPDAKVLLTIPGTFKIEKVVHRQFASARIGGEWFQKTPELLAFIEQRKSFEDHHE